MKNTCAFCKQQFKPVHHPKEEQKYCNRDCYLQSKKSYRLHKRCLLCSTWYLVPVLSRKDKSKFCSSSCTTTYRNIVDNPVLSQGVRDKISASKQGQPSYERTPISIQKMRNSISGDKHWNWQNGKTTENRKLRNCWEYKQWRKSVYERDDYTCQLCKQRGGKLNADHILPWSTHPELRFDLNNGRTLCLTCHVKTDTFGSKVLRSKL